MPTRAQRVGRGLLACAILQLAPRALKGPLPPCPTPQRASTARLATHRPLPLQRPRVVSVPTVPTRPWPAPGVGLVLQGIYVCPGPRRPMRPCAPTCAPTRVPPVEASWTCAITIRDYVVPHAHHLVSPTYRSPISTVLTRHLPL